jgi:CLIP-associating protein 1/2
MKSPDRLSTRGHDAQDEVEVYEDPVDAEVAAVAAPEADKPVLGELPINERINERRRSAASISSDVLMGETSEEPHRGLRKTASAGNVDQLENDHASANNPETLKNRQLLASGIKKIDARTVEVHMFRRMQDVIKSNQEVWGPNDEVFGKLLLVCLDYLETPTDSLKVPAMKAGNLKVQALATIRAMLALYRVETAKYFSRVLCSILRTKAQHDNTSHIAIDLETTADEIVKYGQTSDCLNAVLALIESTPASTTSTTSSIRTITMSLHTLASLVSISAAKSVALTPEQTQRLGTLAVRCLDDRDADVRKADIEFCVALHERIVGPGGEPEGFWKAVAGAREQHLNLLTYYLAKRGLGKGMA